MRETCREFCSELCVDCLSVLSLSCRKERKESRETHKIPSLDQLLPLLLLSPIPSGVSKVDHVFQRDGSGRAGGEGLDDFVEEEGGDGGRFAGHGAVVSEVERDGRREDRRR